MVITNPSNPNQPHGTHVYTTYTTHTWHTYPQPPPSQHDPQCCLKHTHQNHVYLAIPLSHQPHIACFFVFYVQHLLPELIHSLFQRCLVHV